MNIIKLSKSSEQTALIGQLFAKILDYGDVVLLNGELGAGKTTFISGVAHGMGYDATLSSPSFTILNIYSGIKKTKLVHADFYRLENLEDILNTGIEDYIYSKKTVTCIEWGDKIKDYLKMNYIDIRFEYDLASKDTRQINMISNSIYWDKKLNRLKRLF